jgi:hypothetical protein
MKSVFAPTVQVVAASAGKESEVNAHNIAIVHIEIGVEVSLVSPIFVANTRRLYLGHYKFLVTFPLEGSTKAFRCPIVAETQPEEFIQVEVSTNLVWLTFNLGVIVTESTRRNRPSIFGSAAARRGEVTLLWC